MTILEELALHLTTEGEAAVKASLDSVDKSVSKLAKSFGSLVGAFLGRILWQNVIDKSVETAIALSHLSEQTGATVEDLSRLKYAGDLADVSAEDLTTGLKFLTKAMQGVDLETGNAAKSLAAIGVETRDATGKQRPLLDVLLDVADKFKSYADGPAKGALALNIFGRSGQAMIPILNQGSAAIREMFRESDALGTTMSTQAANQLREYDDAMDRVKGVLAGVAREIAVAVTPSLTSFANKVSTSSDAMETLRIIGKEVLSTFAGISYILDVVGNSVVTLARHIKTLFTGLANAAIGVMTGDFDAAAKAIEKGWTELLETNKVANQVFADDAAALAKRINEIWSGVANGPAKKPAVPDPTRPDAPTLTPEVERKKFDTSQGTEYMAYLKSLYDYEQQLAGDDYEKKRAIALRWSALMVGLYGTNSAEFFNAMKDIEQIDQDHQQTLLDQNVAYWNETGRQLKTESDKVLEQQKAMWQEIAGVVANGIEGAFSQMFKQGGLVKGMKALAATVLQGIGGILTRMGTAAIAASPIVKAIAAALMSLNGVGLLAAGVGLVALGATMGAIGGRIGEAGFTPASGANAYSGIAPGTPQGAVRFIFGENSATTAAGMTPKSATHVTLIGPNDPRAQRELQELLNNANRRG